MINIGTVCAVVVTFNRKELLIECLESLKQQTKPLNAIYLIDNASTDDTPQLLLEKDYISKIPPSNLEEPWEKSFIIHNSANNEEIKLHYVRMSKNEGGAGGFYEGIKRAYEKDYDWLWLMDDDTITTLNSLELLLNKINLVDDIGFLCSKVLWKKNYIHWMNIPQIQSIINNNSFNSYEDYGILFVKGASFVSLLFKKEVVRKVGLPIKDFFIWGDDAEYTERITNKGYNGIYVKDSIVYHKTEDNYFVNIISDKPENSWKYYFGIRNILYMERKRSYFIYLLNLFKNLFLVNIDILRHRIDGKFQYIWINTKASLASIFFKPKVIKTLK